MSVVGVLFEEALDYDQGDDGERQERLGDSFSGGGFHALASLVPRAFLMTA